MAGARLILMVAATGVLLGGCPSAPKFRASLIVRVDGEGEAAWTNASEAARAVILRQNVGRLIREVRRDRLRMLESEDPAALLQEAIVAKRAGKGRVRVRIYGDSRWELRRLCRALLNLWESEGMTGLVEERSRSRARPRAPANESRELALARARTRAEDEERRLYQDRQAILTEQAELGRRWQDIEARSAAREKAVVTARKELSEQEVELRRVESILRKPVPDRYRALADADVMRLYTEVADAEGAIAKGEGLPAEVLTQLRVVLARKKQALDLAVGRFDKEAQSRVAEARERLAAAERGLREAQSERAALGERQRALKARLAQSDERMSALRSKLRELREQPAAREDDDARKGRGGVRVYRVRRVLSPCRVRRLEE